MRALGGGNAARALRRLGRDLRARQLDVRLRRLRVRALRAQRRLRLLERGGFVGVVEPDDDLALVHRLIRVDQDLRDALLDLARHRDHVRIDARVVGGLVRRCVSQVPDAEDQRGDDHDPADDEDQQRRAAPLRRLAGLGFGRRRRRAARFADDGPLTRGFGRGFHVTYRLR